MQEFLRERRLIRTDPLYVLKNTKIGIDALSWYAKHVQPFTVEPFLAALGGLPITINAVLRGEIERLGANGIQPVFVLSGLSVAPGKDVSWAAEIKPDPNAQQRHRAWEAYAKGDVNSAIALFCNSGNLSPSDLTTHLMRFFRENRVDFLRAPYFASAQLCALATGEPRLLSGVYGATDLLLYNIPSVILDINVHKGVMEWVDMKALLHELHLTYDQWLDLCLLAGAHHIPPLPILNQSNEPFNFAYELVQRYRLGYHVIQHFEHHPLMKDSMYMEWFLRARCLIRNHVIIDPNCSAHPLTPFSSPQDLHDVIGPRLPNEIYFFISQGLVGTQVVNGVVTGVLGEMPPLVDTEEYRRLMLDLHQLRTVTLSLLTSSLHEFYRLKRVAWVRWFDSEKLEKPDMLIAHGNNPLVTAPTCFHSHNHILIEARRQAEASGVNPSDAIGPCFAIRWHSVRGPQRLASPNPLHHHPQQLPLHTRGPPLSHTHPHAHTPPAGPAQGLPDSPLPPPIDDSSPPHGHQHPHDGQTLRTVEELLCHIHLQTLCLCDFLDASHNVTVHGHALQIPSVHQDECFVVLKLLKLGYLTSRRLQLPASPSHRNPASGPSTLQHPPAPLDQTASWGVEGLPGVAAAPSFLPQPVQMNQANQAHEKEITLLSRVFSILTINLKDGVHWESRVDYDLLGFHSLLTLTQSCLRNLTQMLLLAAVLRRQVRLLPHQYSMLHFRMPFPPTANSALGLVTKTWLEGCDPNMLPLTFPCCADPVADLTNGFIFWHQVMSMVEFLKVQFALPEHIVRDFEAAHTFLQLRRQQSNI